MILLLKCSFQYQNKNDSIGKKKNTSINSKIFSPEMKGKLYELPSVKSKISAHIGSGNKAPIADFRVRAPPPGSYNLKSDFDKDKKKGISMGAGR